METDPRLVERARRGARACGSIATAIGTTALAGWIVGVDVLRSVVPGLVTMKANTSVCLILTGLALRILADPACSVTAHRVARGFAGTAGAVALAVCSQYVHGNDLGIDQFLFREAAGAVGTVHPGRMALNTSLAFILCAAALLGLGRRWVERLAAPLALVVVAMSFVALVGYLAGVTSLYGFVMQTQMAVPTAAGFLLLGSGLLLTQPHRHPARLLCAPDLGGSLMRRLLPAVVLVPVGLGLLRLEGQQLGFYDTTTGTWLMVLSIVTLTLPLVWKLSAALSRTDRERAHGEAIMQGRYRVSRALTLARSSSEAIPWMLETTCRSFGWELGTVWLHSRGERVVRFEDAWAGEAGLAASLRVLHDGAVFELGSGIPGQVAATGEPIWARDAGSYRTWAALPDQLGIRSALCVPVLVGDRVHGVIELFSRRIEEPDQELLEAVGSIGVELGYLLERDRAEAARREAEDRFRLSFEKAAIGMAVTSLDNHWIEVNPALCEFVGYSADELMRLTWQEITHPDDLTKDVTQVGRALRGAVPFFQTEKRYIRSDGGIRWATVTNSLIRDGTGRPLHWVNQIIDVTDRRQAELEAAAARDAALEASRLKSEFLANMSHEIRTPMNGVIGMTELLRETPLDSEQREYVQLLHSSGETLVAIVNEILDLSKIEAGKVEVDPVDFCLGEAIEDVVELMAGRGREKGVELSVLVEANVPVRARGDETRMRQILANLVANAVKFTDRGEVGVRASIAARSATIDMVLFEVTDTGIGIDAEHIERLFEPFSQADSSTTRVYGGSGLGLTIARQLTEMMGGEIGAESEPGVGSRFWFMLPLEGARSVERDTTPAAVEPLAGQRLLVVDDNSTNRTIVAHHGRSWGMRVDSASDTDAALRLMRAAASEGDSYAYAALDMHMPGDDGLALARTIKADAELRGARLLLLTSSFDLRRVAREAGVSCVLRKPIRRTRLLDALLHRDLPTGEAAPEGSDVAGATVLVAEDNEVNRLLAVRMLERHGVRADVASDGQQAVEMAAKKRYDAVLMDCHMPRMDGYDAARAIRRAEAGGDRVPLIAVSASSLPDDHRRCLAAGMDDFVAKPLDRGVFDAALARWIGRGGAAAAVPVATDQDPAGEAFDAAALAQLHADIGDDAFVRELLVMFRDQTETRLREVASAIADGDAETVCTVAHTIKGGAASVAASGVREAALRLEETGREGRLDESSEASHALTAAVDLMKQAIDKQEVTR